MLVIGVSAIRRENGGKRDRSHRGSAMPVQHLGHSIQLLAGHTQDQGIAMKCPESKFQAAVTLVAVCCAGLQREDTPQIWLPGYLGFTLSPAQLGCRLSFFAEVKRIILFRLLHLPPVRAISFCDTNHTHTQKEQTVICSHDSLGSAMNCARYLQYKPKIIITTHR